MKFTFWLLSAYSIFDLSCADIKAHPAAKNLTNEVDKCSKDNSFPVCGTNGVENLLFGNECLLNTAGQIRGGFTKTNLKACVKDCEHICQGVYDPICAINLANNVTRTFDNTCEIVKDTCRTEIDWKLKKQGRCVKFARGLITLKNIKVSAERKEALKRKRQPIPCPKIFNPVCAVYTGVKSTFINECLVNAENVKTGKDWKIYSQGICEEDYSSVSLKPKRHNIKKRSFNLNEFDNYENTFGEQVTLIRPPSIFHTQFIKNEDSESIFNTEEDYLRDFYESNLKNKPQLLKKSQSEPLKTSKNKVSMSNFENYEFEAEIPADDFGLAEMLKNLRNYETPMLYPVQTKYQTTFEQEGPIKFSQQNQFKVENCKLGATEVCGRFQHKTRTFKNVCELNFHNELSGEDWILEHKGVCKDCNFKCPTNFEPLCISMKGLQYTIRNECILNAAICKHENRDWKIIKNGICDDDISNQYKNIEDKYETVAPGFRFTSKYRNVESTIVEPIMHKCLPQDDCVSKVVAVNLQTPKDQNPTSSSKEFQKKILNLKAASKSNNKMGVHLNHLEKKEKPDIESKEKNSPTTPRALKDKNKNALTSTPVESIQENFKTDRNESDTFNRTSKEDTQQSIYGLYTNSIMTALLKAFDETSEPTQPNQRK